MLSEFMLSKIHRATVTDANLNYVGSITVDEDLMKAAGIKEWQKVDVVNINNGERLQTYVIKGKSGSKVICLNGAAARKAEKGDKVIIITYGLLEYDEVKDYKPNIVLVDDENNIVNNK